jgi:hypothetical protein
MSRSALNFRWLQAALIGGAGLVLPIAAVEPTNPAPAVTGVTTNPDLPPVPVAKSPVELFRELLVMPSSERKLALSIYPPAVRERILEKLGDYQILPPEEREYRLRATELRWYLLPLLNTPATNHAAQLETIPADIRPLVESRLLHWQVLPPTLKQEILANEEARRYLTQPELTTPGVREKLLAAVSPDRRAALEAGIGRLQALPEAERTRTLAQFNQFFDLTAREKEKALRTLSDAERRQMEKTLEQFGQLTREQRAQCLHSFEQFANLSLPERQLFLQNAERWSLMSPGERQAWRELVSKVPEWPPMPPLVIPPPPMPPSPKPRGVLVVTNGN